MNISGSGITWNQFKESTAGQQAIRQQGEDSVHTAFTKMASADGDASTLSKDDFQKIAGADGFISRSETVNTFQDANLNAGYAVMRAGLLQTSSGVQLNRLQQPATSDSGVTARFGRLGKQAKVGYLQNMIRQMSSARTPEQRATLARNIISCYESLPLDQRPAFAREIMNTVEATWSGMDESTKVMASLVNSVVLLQVNPNCLPEPARQNMQLVVTRLKNTIEDPSYIRFGKGSNYDQAPTGEKLTIGGASTPLAVTQVLIHEMTHAVDTDHIGRIGGHETPDDRRAYAVSEMATRFSEVMWYRNAIQVFGSESAMLPHLDSDSMIAGMFLRRPRILNTGFEGDGLQGIIDTQKTNSHYSGILNANGVNNWPPTLETMTRYFSHHQRP